jgi:class 3 adenylate cyclase
MKKTGTLKLYIPLFLLLFSTLILGGFITTFFEGYSRMDFQTFMKYIDDNRELINIKLQETIIDESEIDGTFPDFLGSNYVEDIENQHPAYKMRDLSFLFVFFIIYWLFPVYKQNYTGKYDQKELVHKRIMRLPLIILLLPWVIGLYRLFFNLFFNYKLLGELDSKVVGIYIVSFLLFSTMINYFNLGVTNRYINNKIAQPNYKGADLFSLKAGFSIKLGLRIFLLIFSLAIIPLIINLYIPISFNYWRFKILANEATPDIAGITRILIPLIAMALVTLFYIAAQISAIFSLKKSIIEPMDQLIERMKTVAKGDFTSRSSVLTADEIGQMKGHFNSMVEGLEERERIRDTFGKFVSMEIAEKIMGTGDIHLAGEEIETTVMFTDIRNFTPLSEELSPMDLIDFLNTYFSYMVKPIQDERGVINKFLGDSIMAVFSPVFGVEKHSSAAVRAALKLRASLKELNSTGKFPEVRHGVGIHTGILIAGNIGAEERKEYTVIGDTVNIASRIESQTKVFNTDILLSENLVNQIDLKEFPKNKFLPYEPVLMKGKSYSMTLFQIE